MNNPANSRSVLILNAAAAATNADTTAAIDTLGYRACRLAVYQSTSNAPTTIRVDGSDDATNYVTLNMVGGTDFTIATNNSNATTAPHYVFDVTGARMRRYLRVTIRPATAAANLACHATLGSPAVGLVNTAAGVSANGGYLSVPSAT